MKEHKIKFVERGLLFLAILASIVLILNVIYITTVQEKNNLDRQDTIYYEYINNLGTKEINYVFFGDSHTRYGINPMYIDDSFNFGIPSENYIETYYKFKKILEEDNGTINNIVLEVDLHTFKHKSRPKERLFSDSYYANIVPINEMLQLKYQNVVPILIQEYFPVIGNGLDLVGFFITPPTTTSPTSIYLGWANNTGNFSSSNRSQIANTTYERHFGNDNPNGIEEIRFEYFMKVLEVAKNNEVNVIFIKYPVSKEYDDFINKNNITKDEYYEFIFANVNDTLGENYTVLDYYDVFFEHAEYFFDPDHLNDIGSKNLSEKIQSDLMDNNVD